MKSLRDRFLAKVSIPEDEKACWLWKAAKIGGAGYGTIGHEYRSKLAHRVSYELFVGPIPDRLWVLHRCDNPSCVNPEHLFLGTHADNMADMAAKGRAFRNRPLGLRGAHKGEENHWAKLTAPQVLAIREAVGNGQTKASVARLYGISESTVRGIAARRVWGHVE